jgi:hypothetical protein
LSKSVSGTVAATTVQPRNGDAQFPASNTKLTYKITNATKTTFGYDVYADGRMIIHQPCIPALPGSEGFKSESDAEKVAHLVIEKLKQGATLPTISIDDMKQLHTLQ